MKKLILLLLTTIVLPLAQAQITITVGTTPVKTGVKRPGINLGPDTYYGQGQVRRNLGVAGGGYYAKPVWQTTYLCTSGGTTNTTTSWYSGQVSYSSATPYGTNFWAGATYEAVSQTGALLGTGTVTASTAQTTSAGITFTLGTALTAACQQNSGGTAGQDVLIVSKRNTGNDYSQVTPFGENSQVSSSATFNTTSYPTGFTASVALPNGATASVYPDATTNNQVNLTSTAAVPYTNFNGTYTVQYWLACSTGTCSTSWKWGRNAGAFSGCSGTDTGTTTWALKTHTCTPTETGTQTTSSQFSLSATSANVLFNGQDVIEGTAISPANVTAYRDAVVKELRAINPGVIRHMYPDLWASTIQDEITAAGTRGWPNISPFNSVGNANGAVFGTPTGYAEQLELCYVIGSDCQLTMGKFTQPGDMTALMNFLGVANATGYSTSYGSSWNSLYAAKGLHIYLAYGNEPWNSQAGGTLESGNGYAYGYLVGQLMPAFYAASGYNSAVDFPTAGSWAVQSQSAGAYGFTQQFLNQAGCATGTPTHCPKFVELAPYTIDTLDTVTPTTVDADEVAEVINGDTAGTSGNSSSMFNAQTYTAAHWPVNVSVYEYAYSPTGGSGTPTQLQMNQISAGVGMGLNMSEHALLMIRDSGVVGPTSFFSFADYVASSSLGVAGTYWVGERLVSCGPGVIGTCNAISNPAVIAFKMINTAIGTKTNLLTQTVSGTGTTFSYAGGQGGTIPANSAVATVNCFPFADSSSNYAMICYNNTTSSQTVNLAGAAAPLSSTSVTYATLGGSTNAVTDNNLQATLASPTAVVAQPTTTAGTGFNTLTLQPRQLWVGTYSLSGGTPTVANPTFSPPAGGYGPAQSVTITSATSGATICYTTNGSTPAATTAGTCSIGSTLANGGSVTVSSTQTLMALGTLSGSTNSGVASASYTINGTVPTPVFSPTGGTYSSTQSVTLTDSNTGASIYYCIGSCTPTSGSTLYTGAISVSSTETINAVAIISGYTNSAIASATYTIGAPTAVAPVFSPAGGSYSAAQSVTLSSTTSGANIYYCIGSCTPTSSSTLYSSPIAVSSTETLNSIAIATGYTNSAVSTATYTITMPAAATPTFSPAGGTFSSTQSVTISDATVGSSIYYTTDGSTPSTSSTPYSGPVNVSTSMTLNAIATASGYSNSAVGSASYSITGSGSTTIAVAGIAYCYAAQPCALTATMGNSSATGTVTFYNGTTTLGTATLSGGVATYSASLPYGDDTVGVTYGGDGTFAPITTKSTANQLVLLNTVAVTLSSNNYVPPSGSTFTLTVNAACSSCSTTPAGSVLFYDYYWENTTGTASNGASSLTVASATGILAGFTVTGAGIPLGEYVQAVSGTTVTLAIPTTAALAATPLTFAGTYLLGGAAKTLSSGQYLFNQNTLVPGEHYIQAVYLSDNTMYAEGHSLIVHETVTVAATACTANVSTSLAPAVYYIANNGSDTATGTCAAPFQHISKAVSLMTSPGDIALLRQGDLFPETVTFAQGGTSSAPYTFGNYVGSGMTTTNAPPVISGRDKISSSATWTLVSSGTYSTPYTGYPSKLCIDAVNQECSPILPTINYRGPYAAGTFAPYDVVYDVTASSSYFARLTTSTTSGGFNANLQSWGGIPTVPASMQTTGLANVEALPGYFYANGTTLYEHLLDGSNPNTHVSQVSTRNFAFDLRGASWVNLQGLSIEGATFTGVNIQPTASSSSATEDHISVLNSFVYNSGNTLVTYDYPNLASYFTGNIAVTPWQGSGTSYPVTNTTLTADAIGAIDVYPYLNYNVEGVAVHATTNFAANALLVAAINGEGLSFQSYSSGPVTNTGASMSNSTFINDQGCYRISGAPSATLANNSCHHFIGFGLQVGGGSTNVTENGGLYFNGRGSRGMSDLLTLGTPGGSGTLYNCTDVNGTSNGLTRHHITAYNCGGNAMTNEYVSDGLGSGACGTGTCSYDNMILDASTETRPDTTYGTGAYAFWVRYQSQPSNFWSNNGVVPYSAQANTIDWKNSSGGDHAIVFGQFELNNSGNADIYATASNFTNPTIGDFSLAANSPFCNTGLQIAAMGDRAAPNIGYVQNACTTESPGTLSSIAILPGTPGASQFGFTTVPVGQYLAFTATATYSDGSQRTLPPSAITWTSSAPSNASISSQAINISPTTNGAVATNGVFGKLLGLATGTTNVTATSGGVTSSALPITVTAGTAIPTASPAPGSYTTAQTITLADTTSGAVIYYTTDGSTPTTSSAVYSSPIPVSVTTTINAIAVASGSTSSVGSFAYTITSLPSASTPTFSPAAGLYSSAQTVTISDTTPGAVIHYTLDGSTPTSASPVYSAPLTVSVTTTVNAIAIASGYMNSAVGSAVYTINLPPAATPTFTPAAGTYSTGQSVTIADATSGATIYYTTDGSSPTTSSAVYSAAIPVNVTTTIKAIAKSSTTAASSTASATYTIMGATVAVPFTCAGTCTIHVTVTVN